MKNKGQKEQKEKANTIFTEHIINYTVILREALYTIRSKGIWEFPDSILA